VTRFVEVAVILPRVQGTFHYHVPPELAEQVRPGHLVRVPFASQRVQGIVLGRVEVPEVSETRPLEGLVDRDPVLTPAQIELGRWMSRTYAATLGECFELMLPPGLAQRAQSQYALGDPGSAAEEPLQKKIIALIAERGPLRSGQLTHAFPRADWEREAARLAKRGVLVRTSVLPPPAVRARHVRTARLALPGSQVREVAQRLRQTARAQARGAADRRARVLEFLAGEHIAVDVSWVYAHSQSNLADLKWLAEEGLVDLDYEEVWRDPLAGRSYAADAAPRLTPDQQRAWDHVRGALLAGEPRAMLLHGVTGSGKTEIYLLAVAEVLARGRQAIVLVPEISLTPQTLQRFGARVTHGLGLQHSRLSDGERYDTWRRARSGLIEVMLGPRSALFAPLPQPGILILDEEHDDSYKSNRAPYFHARETALEYARLLGIPCLLGSATPDVVTYARAKESRLDYLTLPERAPFAGAPPPRLPEVKVVDMRRELREGNRSIFSRELERELGAALSRGEQAILFLNRRGAASALFCRSCGQSVACPRCGLPLTYHGAAESAGEGAARGRLRCHHCNYERGMPARCPNCGSDTLRPLGVGTQRVEAEVVRRFPGARVLRWDVDTTRAQGAHEILLEHFAAGRADVLVGTQMVAKGLDLPRVSLVGAILAEVGLFLPDYRAAERTFQVLTQVIGRAGRSPRGGRALLQTFQPEHYAIQLAAAQDYAGFAQAELARRRPLGYPPFTRLARLLVTANTREEAQRTSESLARAVRAAIAVGEHRQTEIVGPTPCYFEREAGRYRWQLIVRGPQPRAVIPLELPDTCTVDIDPVSLL
jgi:primosomal protein N' (replication factor Y) (superfamily II helicase)